MLKLADAMVAAGPKDEAEVKPLEKLISEAFTEIDKAVGKGIIHKNNAARKKSRCSRCVRPGGRMRRPATAAAAAAASGAEEGGNSGWAEREKEEVGSLGRVGGARDGCPMRMARSLWLQKNGSHLAGSSAQFLFPCCPFACFHVRRYKRKVLVSANLWQPPADHPDHAMWAKLHATKA